MDYNKVKEFLNSQRSRSPRPMDYFCDQMILLSKSIIELSESNISHNARNLFFQLSMTKLITLIECYYRDSLDAIFRLCKHTAYLATLDKIIKTKFSAREILELEKEGLHFLQTIPQQLSFQNLNQICFVYDNYFEKGLSKEILEYEYRLKDMPDYHMKVSPDTLASIEKLFSLRHELVHNPGSEHSISQDVFQELLGHVWDFVFCSDQAIIKFMGAHIKDEVKRAEQGGTPYIMDAAVWDGQG